MTAPAVVWLVRDLASDGPDVIATFPGEREARAMTATLRDQGRRLIVERWDVPGHE